tara:strand:+ start:212 stop:802 length:591 start_codon:yes stop_codon:yes gene_type:complete
MASELQVTTLKGVPTGANANQIVVASGQKIVGTDSGSIVAPGCSIQVINSNNNTKFSFTSSNTWVNTGLVSLTFPNALQTGSKVLVRVYATLGEAHDNSWGSATAITIFENSVNKGDATYGISNGNAQMTGNTSYTQYEGNRLSGELLFTPSVTNGTYTLYALQKGAGTKYIGGVGNNDAAVPQGTTQVTLMEIAQ